MHNSNRPVSGFEQWTTDDRQCFNCTLLFVYFIYFLEQLHVDIDYVAQSVEHETLYLRVVDY